MTLFFVNYYYYFFFYKTKILKGGSSNTLLCVPLFFKCLWDYYNLLFFFSWVWSLPKLLKKWCLLMINVLIFVQFICVCTFCPSPFPISKHQRNALLLFLNWGYFDRSSFHNFVWPLSLDRISLKIILFLLCFSQTKKKLSWCTHIQSSMLFVINKICYFTASNSRNCERKLCNSGTKKKRKRGAHGYVNTKIWGIFLWEAL